MVHSKKQSLIFLVILLTAFSLTVNGHAKPGDKGTVAAQVVPLAASSQLVSLLPDSLAGMRATSELKRVERDNLGELVGDKATLYREYRVTSAVSREYGRARVYVFETQHQLAAFGLLTFNRGTNNSNVIQEDLGSGALRLDDELCFFKDRFLIRIGDRIGDSAHNNARAGRSGYEALARAIAAEIMPANTAITWAALLDSLPAASMVPGSQRYFLGPESLNTYVEHAREMFDFNGDTEAVVAQYTQGSEPQAANQSISRAGSSASAATSSSPGVLKLAIVEYHTPQLATDAMNRASEYLASLSEGEQQQIIIKRIGNYIVEAANVRDRSDAEGLINSVQYPYTVKWLRNPLWPTNDPFRAQKAAQMLISTFGLLGVILMTVLGVGTVFGTTIFLKRRKRQQEIFSDAGGMLRLDIDQLESSMLLRLPPAREE